MAEGFHAGTTVDEVSRWWLDAIGRHRVRITTWTTYAKQLRIVGTHLGNVAVRQLRPEQVAAFLSQVTDSGSAARPRNQLSELSSHPWLSTTG